MAFRSLLELTKPERTMANVITAAAGFLLASSWPWDLTKLLATVAGVTLIIASACVANNLLDRNLDARMARTRKRVLPTQQVAPWQAAVLLAVLGIVGFTCLAWWVNSLVVWLGVVAYVDYVFLYGWSKRHSVWSTWIGSVCGSLSLVAGYCSVSGRLNVAAWLLFGLMVFWQMAHFYAIGIYRLNDYQLAGLPIWSVRYGINSVIWQIKAFVLLLVPAVLALFIVDGIRLISCLTLLAAIAYWLRLVNAKTTNPDAWARQNFRYSLVFILLLSAVLAVNNLVRA